MIKHLLLYKAHEYKFIWHMNNIGNCAYAVAIVDPQEAGARSPFCQLLLL